MIRAMLMSAVVLAATTAALAQSNPIAERKELMKSNGAVTRAGTQMVRGEAPFDPVKAKEIFANYERVGTQFPLLFPESTKTGDTRAAPRIWEDMAGFRQAAAKLVTDATEAAAATNSLDTFKAGFAKATANCNACHETYRINR